MASNLERAQTFFNKLSKENLAIVDDFYDPNVVFQDPVHKLVGVTAIKKYYQHQYESVDSIRFEYIKLFEKENEVSLSWRMYLKSPSLQSGQEITVDGASFFTFDEQSKKVIFQRDYFDMGEFVYERVPLLKSLIHFIKNKLAGST